MEPGNSHVDSGKYEGGAIIALYVPKYSILKCISGAWVGQCLFFTQRCTSLVKGS